MNSRLNRWIGTGIFLLFGLGAGTQALANPVVKQVEVHQGDEVVLTLDSKLDASQVTTEYLKDIIQLTLSHASVYPARVKSSANGVISKVFVYQYNPKQVRCRISVRGHAEAFRKNFKIHFSGRSLQVKLTSPVSESDQKTTVEKLMGVLISPQEEQKKLQEKIEQSPLNQDLKPEKTASKPSTASLSGAKPLPSFGGVFLKLCLVVGLFGLFAVLVKKFGGQKKIQSTGILSAISKVSGLKIGSKDSLIEVLSTQHLGPKKSISVVRVAGRTLVLGLSQDSIQLITQIHDSDTHAEEFDLGEDLEKQPQGNGASFADFLGEQKTPPPSVMESQGVRSRIRSRLEGLKPL